MFCPECDLDFDTTGEAIDHEETTGHGVVSASDPDFWDEVDYEYAKHKENW